MPKCSDMDRKASCTYPRLPEGNLWLETEQKVGIAKKALMEMREFVTRYQSCRDTQTTYGLTSKMPNSPYDVKSYGLIPNVHSSPLTRREGPLTLFPYRLTFTNN